MRIIILNPSLKINRSVNQVGLRNGSTNSSNDELSPWQEHLTLWLEELEYPRHGRLVCKALWLWTRLIPSEVWSKEYRKDWNTSLDGSWNSSRREIWIGIRCVFVWSDTVGNAMPVDSIPGTIIRSDHRSCGILWLHSPVAADRQTECRENIQIGKKLLTVWSRETTWLLKHCRISRRNKLGWAKLFHSGRLIN